ncbi:WD40/YVTN/BNR-like repeat-containing protein [Aquimarina sp. 2201CG14-23]|uniref:WD40/YVTN/BNR-like repeat-containing protein n=1 Tax=Aquimarina mycalae TaxID=3040073 RepID=UPI0024780ABE|nr:oxidoreductase [Aquimarina sp. 2201CG14-23]MDH7447205.1 oxidoreductase [Aquimarina sp. 2201CG14-23]
MRFLLLFLVVVSFFNCGTDTEKVIQHNFSEVIVKPVFSDSVSIRAIEVTNDLLMFAGNNGMYGTFDIDNTLDIKGKKISVLDYEGKKIHFRAIADTETDFFVLSIASPALLYKINKVTEETKLVYKEVHEKVFYDAIAFWNNKEGIAMGDPTDGCLSMIITRDGGETWDKVSCDKLPKTIEGEAAFAASNGNISIVGCKTWVVSGGMKSRVFYSADKGNSWSVSETPIIQGTATTGTYSIDFYDEKNGVIYGGDYTKPSENKGNKAITTDGGVTWNLVADGVGADYKSCIRYVPNSGGLEMIATGFTGISISNDAGNTWKEISKEGFYTMRFINDSTAVAAGKNRIATLNFKKQKSK